MITVSNTSPVLNLAAIGESSLLEKLFGPVLIPPAVLQETQRLQNSDSRFAKVYIPSFVQVTPFQNLPLSEALKVQLHPGEAQAIALAIELGATRTLLDEHRARVIAKRLGLRTLGCLGILLEAKNRGMISRVRPILDQLETEAGFRVGSNLRAQVLMAAGE